MIIYDDHIWWSYMIMKYDMIVGDHDIWYDRRWSSYVMILYDDHIYDHHIWWSCMVIIYDENVDEHFERWLCFRSIWGPFGYVLASSLVSKKLSRPSNDHFFQLKWIGLKRRSIIVRAFSATQIIQKSLLDLIYALSYVYISWFSEA